MFLSLSPRMSGLPLTSWSRDVIALTHCLTLCLYLDMGRGNAMCGARCHPMYVHVAAVVHWSECTCTEGVYDDDDGTVAAAEVCW